MENFSPPKVSSTVIFGLIHNNNLYTAVKTISNYKSDQTECIKVYRQWPWYY